MLKFTNFFLDFPLTGSRFSYLFGSSASLSPSRPHLSVRSPEPAGEEGWVEINLGVLWEGSVVVSVQLDCTQDDGQGWRKKESHCVRTD